MRATNAAAFGLRPSAGKARLLILDAAAFGLRPSAGKARLLLLDAAAFGLRPSAGKARLLLLLLALFAASCSYSEETAQIFVNVAGIPAAADHLDVVVTPSDTTVAGKNCPSTLTPAPASNATCYRPSFQPDSVSSGSLDLAFATPAAAGNFTVAVTASGPLLSSPAQGTISGTLPGPVNLQVTLK